MQQVRLYDQPHEFAEMMAQHLSQSLNVQVRQKKEEPLLLEVVFNSEKEDDKSEVSLHETFLTYMRTGDLNTAVDYLNGIVRCSMDLRDKHEEMLKLDTSCIYPVLRSKEYVEQVDKGLGLVVEESIPGLCVIFLELKDGYSKIISSAMLEHHPRLTADRIKRLAFRNLRSEGWSSSTLRLQSPFRKTCTIETFLDNPFPAECQFLRRSGKSPVPI